MVAKTVFKTGYDVWLKDNFDKCSYPELTKKFNELFSPHSPVCYRTIANMCRKMGLRKVKAPNKRYSAEEMNWLAEHYDDDTAENVAKLMTEKFGREMTATKIYDLCRHHFKEYLHKSPKWQASSWVKPGKHSHTGAKHIGDEMEFGGYIWIKVNDNVQRVGTNYAQSGNWRPKHIVIYENYYNITVPDKYVVMFIDGNTHNFDIENLYMVKRGVHTSCVASRWWKTSDDRDLRLAIIKYFEMLDVFHIKHGRD